ncbi:4-fold beta flower protein [Haloechinothrix salitolerans]|uniref:4-fold beta flower protein n=1 Tax=Haloechinothrix salitolerans TaxID=926830 RepID=A0ABW2C2G9_9PSEU
MSLYTKNGRPLQVSEPNVYSRSGTYVGRISGNKIYGANGRYLGTIVGDRVVYRSTDSASIGSPTVSAARAGSAMANGAVSAIWGDEPSLPD